MDVVQDVAAVLQVLRFVAVDAGEYAQVLQEQRGADEVTPHLADVHVDVDAGGGERRILGRELGHALQEDTERRLALRSLEGRQREAQQHVAAAGERGVAILGVARWPGGIIQVGGRLVEASDLAVDDQAPAGVATEPLLQPVMMQADPSIRARTRADRADHRFTQERAEGLAAFVIDLQIGGCHRGASWVKMSRIVMW